MATVVEGVCVTLDPDFDFISVATSFLREEGYIEEGARDFIEDRITEVRNATESAVRVPPKLEDALDRIDREDLHVRADIEDSEGHLDRLALRVVLGMGLASGAVSTAVLYAFSTVEATVVAGAATLLVVALLYRSFRKRRGIRAQPQFTRQNLRERRGEEEGASGALGFGDAAVGEGEAGVDATDRRE